MFSRLTIALPVVLFVAALFPTSVPGQIRGMGSPRAPHAGPVFGHGGRNRLLRPLRHRYYNGYAFYPDYYPGYNYDHESDTPTESPVNIVVEQPSQPSAPAASSTESLLLEYQDGQWVRIPTGGHLPVSKQYTQSEGSGLAPEFIRPKEASQLPTTLPPAVLVFQDGRQEEVGRYVVQGDFLYASANYWGTGTWTRKIPISELDVPATVKLNTARGGSFSLPSRPNEVVVRF